jgi:hypothetical protein
MSFDQKLLVAANCGIALAALNLLRVCVSILFEHYSGLHNGEHEECDRDKHQSPSQSNKLFRFLLHSFGSVLGKLRNQIRNNGVFLKNQWGRHRGRWAVKDRVVNFRMKFINSLTNFFRVWMHK